MYVYLAPYVHAMLGSGKRHVHPVSTWNQLVPKMAQGGKTI